VTALATKAVSESLFAKALRTIGPAKLKAQLASLRLSEFVQGELPTEYQQATALDFVDFLPEVVGRPAQLPPSGSWSTWIFMGGRGTGKTWSGASATIAEAERLSRLVAEGRLAPEEARLHVVAGTAADLRDTIVEGPAGLLRLSPPWFPAQFEPSKRRVVWPAGVQAILLSADEPERARGLQCAFLWCDEFASWRFAEEIWPNLQFGLRLGPSPRAMITTTPRPSRLLRQLIAQPSTVVTRGTTADNTALAPSAVERLYDQHAGSRLGRQELMGELLEDNPAALWRLDQIDAARVSMVPDLQRIIVAVDPAITSRPDSDETGIVVAGSGKCRCRGREELHGFVLADCSGIYTPDQWARAVVEAYGRHAADLVVAEKNQGGDLVENTLRTVDPSIPYKGVSASRGKVVRAEPIAALYAQGKVHHVNVLARLEDQLCQWSPLADRWSPDRLDALVWALSELLVEARARTMAIAKGKW
jgi:phage terminase large subunit-like protein